MHKSGFVSIVGRANVGKSTLLNNFINQKLSIVSSKPQTTRNNVIGILNNDDYQIVFTDTPGYHKPRYKLGDYMIKSISSGLKETDVIIFVANIRKEIPKLDLEILDKIKDLSIPRIFVLNKCDEISSKDIMDTLSKYSKIVNFDEYIPISALNGKNINKLLELILKYLPNGPKYYDSDWTATNNEKFFISEIVREKILKLIHDEVPHGVGVEIISMKYDDQKNRYNIEGNIFCDKETHKAIIIGKNGDMLKRISTYSRQDMEKFLGSKVYIRLWVKVRNNWRDDNNHLKSLGYK
ncbi:GTP-binding protein Era [Candidatus Arthromitus sp. SFB-mouse-Japan]|uniref:GTPase Era n=1 Tax=unclassified Candidatus Neoarthromitus TaxID=2638829 RepID=UPI00021B7F48|nr:MULTISPECIES: GTPase Era [unclassified Candidatus Arthromitus]EIA25550.1 GTP-binding protein [Candidatus Arthromitus sp. SFB-4]EIA28533.1 GTP-binding protein [Candidatus Arthromitus sp. SFB-co]EIA30579.1 GTP-binding protein [Candidatus Arthromitus sp. SFB-mouse-SU]AID44477.1 GTP-binding protein Era [Candidatus Arthromitus sp. SFB-mouse-NL]EGX29016.1 GTP-binding protein [Candidatus Arthromitus sp. SFB-mouse-NYU]